MKVHPYYFSKTKRAFDVGLSLFLLVVLSPLLVAIGLGVLFSSGWPVIYTQRRWGQHKQPFRVYKFRVMYLGAEKHQKRYRAHNQAPEPMYKNWNDPRYVGIGKWLSKTGLDELPQLINILKGEMSFVGPRPLPIAEAQQLPKDWDFRYQVKPGVFSEWSVSENRHTSLAQWKKLEMTTLSYGALTHEILIICRTVTTIPIAPL